MHLLSCLDIEHNLNNVVVRIEKPSRPNETFRICSHVKHNATKIVLSGCEGFVSMVLLHGPTSLPSP